MSRVAWVVVILFAFVIGCCSPQTAKNHPQQSRTPQRDILTDATYKNIIVEVMYVSTSTSAPNTADLDYLREKIQRYCHKANVVIVVDPPLPASVLPTFFWDSSSLAMFENFNARYITAGDTLVIRIIYVPGWYQHDNPIRGLAYGSYAFCLFRGRMVDAHERAVLLHEFGHTVGLVNCGTPNIRDHEEPDKRHKLHCKNENGCVMYWSSPSTQTPDFCDDCKLDLVSNGGKR